MKDYSDKYYNIRLTPVSGLISVFLEEAADIEQLLELITDERGDLQSCRLFLQLQSLWSRWLLERFLEWFLDAISLKLAENITPW